MAPKFLRNVCLDNLHAVKLGLTFSFSIHLVVFPEVFDIFRVDQIFLGGVLAMIFFEVMNLILVLVVAVVSRTKTEVGQFDTVSLANNELGKRDTTTLVFVEQGEDFLNYLFFLCLRDILCAFVLQAVGLADIVRGPCAAAIVVVKVEERSSIKGVDVMLLYIFSLV